MHATTPGPSLHGGHKVPLVRLRLCGSSALKCAAPPLIYCEQLPEDHLLCRSKLCRNDGLDVRELLIARTKLLK